jgi:hypothetical protein
MTIPRPRKPIDVEEARRMRFEEGLSLAEIGRRLGYRANSISRAIRRSGVKFRRQRPRVSTDADRRLYTTWRSIVARCTRPSNPLFQRYGARGIGLCDAWRDFAGFRAWAVASGWRPGLYLGLDVRSRGYAPRNCSWITRSQNIERGILAGPRGARFGITAFGETKTAAAWAKDPRCAVGGQGLLERIGRGMAAERAITLPRHAERSAPGSPRPRKPQGGRKRRSSLRIDWKNARDLHVKKGLGVADTALLLDASYHGILRGLRRRGDRARAGSRMRGGLGRRPVSCSYRG